MNFIVGLTGGIGSGKSVATDYFAQKGIVIVDADDTAHRISRLPEIVEQVGTHFGDEYLTPDHQLDRAKLRKKVFSNPEAKRWLEALLHPRIRAQMLTELRAAHSPYAILSAPLLLENKLEAMVSRVLVVDAPEAVQRQRAAQRDQNTNEEIDKIMRAQLPRHERLARADDILENSGTLEHLHQQIDALHETYLAAGRSEAPDD